MDRFGGRRSADSPESNIERESVEWWYEKVNGRWELVPLPDLGHFDPSTFEEKERRRKNLLQMLQETEKEWKLNDPTVEHNEGFLRDHPQYHDLFVKWAMRYLRMKGFDKGKFSGRIDEDEGNMLDANGKRSRHWLTNEVANGREWIDEYCAMELRISEGFVDITHDYERRDKLGIEPQNEGWWSQDEV